MLIFEFGYLTFNFHNLSSIDLKLIATINLNPYLTAITDFINMPSSTEIVGGSSVIVADCQVF